MSEQLYRVQTCSVLTHDEIVANVTRSHCGVCCLVSVEPCVHGMIPSHPVLAELPDGEMVWTGITCPGAGIGDTDGSSLSDSTRRTSDRIGDTDE